MYVEMDLVGFAAGERAGSRTEQRFQQWAAKWLGQYTEQESDERRDPLTEHRAGQGTRPRPVQLRRLRLKPFHQNIWDPFPEVTEVGGFVWQKGC